jgi:hypothetical protein
MLACRGTTAGIRGMGIIEWTTAAFVPVAVRWVQLVYNSRASGLLVRIARMTVASAVNLMQKRK